MSASGVGVGVGSFARGLSEVLLANRHEEEATAREEEARKAQAQMALLPFVVQHAVNTGDVQTLIDHIGVKPKKGAPDHGEILKSVIAPNVGVGATAPMDADQTAAATKSATDTGTLPNFAPTPAAPAPPRQTVLGVPMLSDEEVAARDQNIAASGMEAKLKTQTDMARRILPKLQELDPSVTLRDALEFVGKGGILPQKTFTPGALVKGVGAAQIPDGALGEDGKPIDKTKAPYWDLIRGADGKNYYTPGAPPPGANKIFKPLTGPLGERFRVLLAKDGLDEETVLTKPEIYQKYLTSAGQQLDAEGKLDRKSKEDLAASLERSRGDSQKLQEELLNDLPTDTDLAKKAKTIVVNGKPYRFVDKGEFAGARAQNAASKAGEKAGVLVVSPDEANQLKAAQAAFSNLNDYFDQIKSKLPKDANGRPIIAAENKLGQYFQTDDQLAAADGWDVSVLPTLNALRATGRIPVQEFNRGLAARPLITDTLGAAEQKKKNLEKILTNAVRPILEQGSSFSATLNDKIYTFDTEAKLDAFKRQFPAAK